MLALSPHPSSTGQSLTAPSSLENSFQPTGWVPPPWGTTHHRWWTNTRLGKASPWAWEWNNSVLCFSTPSYSRWSELWEDRLKVPSGTEKGVNSCAWDAHYWRQGGKFMVRYSLWNERLKLYVLMWGKPPRHINDGWGNKVQNTEWVDPSMIAAKG